MDVQQESSSRGMREASEFCPPEYQISYGQDQTLQWSPLVGSRDLAIALSYHFPLQTDLESKMQAATRRFLREEQDKAGQPMERVTSLDENASSDNTLMKEISNVSTIEEQPKAPPTLQFLTWDLGMKEYSPKAKRRRYEKGERIKVAANRGFACDQHRRMKMKCDPERCPRNKQRLNNLETQEVEIKSPESAHMKALACLNGQPVQMEEANDVIPLQSDTLSVFSIGSSAASQRWSASSCVGSMNTFDTELSEERKPSDFSPTMHLENTRSYDSISSILPIKQNLDFLSAYDDYFINTSLVPGEYLMDTSDIPPPLEPIPQATLEETLNFDSGAMQSVERFHQNQNLETGVTRNDTCSNYDLALSNNTIINHSDSSNPMEWDFTQAYDPNVVPLTIEQKDTLIKWWGRDRLTEPPSSTFSRPTSSQKQSSLSLDTGSVSSSLGRRNTLADKVRAVHVPTPFRRGSWMGRNSGEKSRTETILTLGTIGKGA
ncbi:hypothetical protein BJ875DRAFT_476708 [Amylocarpus encephaloides]|uniref:Uncharacterized protein n=1 Tax=Amylocarpus encephaloides TaxID=45428 RepID=A0A9P7Y973_9HELO|nr:hypothetical protein BJ875DRAFT_476708 [Amylocarpus encephaloides]